MLLTCHNDKWVLDRPEWSFGDAAEPLAAAAQACRDDPFVQNLNCESESDVLRIADQFPLDSWSVSLELCPETVAASGALRLCVHLALVRVPRKRGCGKGVMPAWMVPFQRTPTEHLCVHSMPYVTVGTTLRCSITSKFRSKAASGRRPTWPRSASYQ